MARVRFPRTSPAGHRIWLAHRDRVLAGLAEPDDDGDDALDTAGALGADAFDAAGAFDADAFDDAVAAAGDVLVWELLTANNRPLVRSTGFFASFAAARRDAHACVRAAAAGGLEARRATDAATGQWGFAVLAAGTPGLPLAVCGHWYARLRKCEQGADAALTCLCRASLAPAAVRLDRADHPSLPRPARRIPAPAGQ